MDEHAGGNSHGSPASERLSLFGRLDSWSKRNALLALVLFTAVLLTAVSSVVRSADTVHGWYADRYELSPAS